MATTCSGSTSCDGRACHGPHCVRPLPSRRGVLLLRRAARGGDGGDAAGVFDHLVLGGAGVLRFAARRAGDGPDARVAVAAGGGDRAGEPAFLGIGFPRGSSASACVRSIWRASRSGRAWASCWQPCCSPWKAPRGCSRPDKVMALFGNAAPTVGLMLSMTARLVPQFVRRGTDIGGVQRACTAARSSVGESGGDDAPAAPRGAALRDNLRLSSVLMGWSMEDSLETASAMKARGWGAAVRRTTYARHRFRRLDAAALAVGGALALLAAVAAWAACAQFRFYPVIDGLAPWWNYCPMRCTRRCRCRWRQGSACGGGHEGGRSNDGTGVRKREG